jgi:acetylornithine/succinyldiaminopimelate/putrescine aminotransferase
MSLLKHQPELGHITTFGGHPLIAAACRATLEVVTKGKLMEEALEKEQLIRELLTHKAIKEIRGKGLMLALILESDTLAKKLVQEALESGLILFFLLFEPKAVRITPPLTITKKELKKGCGQIIYLLNKLC